MWTLFARMARSSATSRVGILLANCCRRAAFCSWVAAGCQGTEPTPDYDRVEANWLTESARASLGPDGRFVSVASVPEYPEELDREAIEQVGTAFVRSIPARAGNLRTFIEERHGAIIDFAGLRACGRTLYLRSSFARIPLAPTESTARSETAGRWLVTYCLASGVPAVLQNIFAGTTVGEQLKFHPTAGGDFYSFGLPESGEEVVLSPEKAVGVVYGLTQTRIRSVPEPVADLFTLGPMGPNGRPYGALWRIEIEHPVTVELEDGRQESTEVFFVGLFASSAFKQRPAIAGPPLPPFVATFLHYDATEDKASLHSVTVTPRWALSLLRVARRSQ